jgi:hypothetical protein
MRTRGGSKGELGEVITVMFDARLDVKIAVAAWLLEHPGFHLIEGSEKDNSHLPKPFRSAMFRRGRELYVAKGGR